MGKDNSAQASLGPKWFAELATDGTLAYFALYVTCLHALAMIRLRHATADPEGVDGRDFAASAGAGAASLPTTAAASFSTPQDSKFQCE